MSGIESSGDMQQYYRNQGYRIAGDGAVEFYYVAFRTNKKSKFTEICLTGLFSWSGDQHDPAKTIAGQIHDDANYRYSRQGPYPKRSIAETTAIQFATQIHGDPTQYGIWGTGGLHDINNSHYRDPKFR